MARIAWGGWWEGRGLLKLFVHMSKKIKSHMDKCLLRSISLSNAKNLFTCSSMNESTLHWNSFTRKIHYTRNFLVCCHSDQPDREIPLNKWKEHRSPAPISTTNHYIIIIMNIEHNMYIPCLFHNSKLNNHCHKKSFNSFHDSIDRFTSLVSFI